MNALTTQIVWYPHTQTPSEQNIVQIAVDLGPNTDPDAFRVFILGDLYEFHPGTGTFHNLLTGQTLTDKVFYWADYAELLTSIEGQIELEGAK